MDNNTTTDIKHDTIINKIIQIKNYKTYLEIGVQYANNYNKIKIDTKTGIEPTYDHQDTTIIKTTSDNYFKNNKNKYDIIFIDGDHNEETVTRDIQNSLRDLNPDGTIILHDAYPPDENHTNPNLCGTVYKAIWKHRQTKGTKTLTYAGDYGVCLIKKDNNSPQAKTKVTNYNDYKKNAIDILNIQYDYGTFEKQLQSFLH